MGNKHLAAMHKKINVCLIIFTILLVLMQNLFNVYKNQTIYKII